MRQITITCDPHQPPFRSVDDITAALEGGRAEIIRLDGVPPGGVPAPPPSLIQRAANFATSAAKHVAAGMPQATQEQIDARFAICQACEHYDSKACRLCGCPVAREKAFVSKLSWANEKCPAGKWGPATG